MKRVPRRMCIACSERKDQSELLRIARGPDGLFVNEGRRADGRGAWICRNAGCADRMVKRRGLDRSFRTHFSDETYLRIREEMRQFCG